jgi:hypothetical protein
VPVGEVVTRKPGSAQSMAHVKNPPGHLYCMSELHKIATRWATPPRSRRGSILSRPAERGAPAAVPLASPPGPGLGGNGPMRGIRQCSVFKQGTLQDIQY